MLDDPEEDFSPSHKLLLPKLFSLASKMSIWVKKLIGFSLTETNKMRQILAIAIDTHRLMPVGREENLPS